MDALPTELLDEIVQHCDHASQKALRSTSRTFNNLATPLVFERFYFAPCTFETNLRELDALIKSKKTLASQIKHVHVYADILPEWDRHEFETQALRHSDVERQIGVGPALLKFDECCKAQREWYLQNDEYLRIIKELLSSLPNLRSASVGITVPLEGSTRRWPLWSRVSSEIILSPDDWMFNQGGGYPHEDNHGATWTTLATINLLEAIGFRSSFAGITQVKKLKVHTLKTVRLKTVMEGRTFDDSNLTFSPRVESRFETLLTAFDHITALDLDILHPARGDHEEDIPSAEEQDRLRKLNGDEVCQILSRAKNLKRLSLAYGRESGTCWEPGDEDSHPLSSLFQAESNHWPSLQSLRLSVDLPHTLLLSLLGLLAATLRDLDLRDMCVYDAETLFSELPKVTAVETIYIEDLSTKTEANFDDHDAPASTYIIPEGLDVDQPYEKALKAYLLGRVEDFPGLPGAEFEEDGHGEASQPQQSAE